MKYGVRGMEAEGMGRMKVGGFRQVYPLFNCVAFPADPMLPLED